MIRLCSVTSNGDEELANYAQSLLQDRGFKATLQQVAHSIEEISKRQFNVIGIMGDPLVDKKIRKGLLLVTHLDTVSGGLSENWTETGGDPFAATIKEGKVFGLGAADAKLDFLCKLHAAGKFREKSLKQPIYLVGTCGQELGMFGARYLIKSGALNPRQVLVGEPTALKLVHAHKSFSVYRVSIGYQQIERDARGFNRRIDLHSFGLSAHGSNPGAGRNAIESALKLLQQASDNGFEIRYTRFDGGDTVNKVPDRAAIQFYLTSHQFEDFKRFFREVARAEGGPNKDFRVELGGVGDSGIRFLPDPVFSCIMDVLRFFGEMGRDFAKVRDEGFDPPHSTASFGTLRQALGRIDLHFDLRLLPDLIVEEIEKHVREGIQKIAAGYPNLNVTVARERTNPGLSVKDSHELVNTCREAMSSAGLEPALGKKSSATEAAPFAVAGFDAVAFGPGSGDGNSHGPNEHNLLEQIEKATSFYEKLIERVCM